jgi:hypothetical protein
MPRPVDKDVAARTRGKFVAPAGERPSTDIITRPPPARGPPEIEFERIVTLDEAAKLAGISVDGLRRHYAHLIRRLSPRRVGMRVRDALSIGAAA